jgi:hypothetical protein
MVEAAMQETSKPNPPKEYNTEYDGSFGVRDFIPSMDSISQGSEVSLVRKT